MASSSIDQFKKSEEQSIRHVTIRFPVAFSDFTKSFESKLGRITMNSFANAKTFADLENVTNKINAGKPFAIFNIYDHGGLATKRAASTGSQKRVIGKRYDFGNVLFATSMTVHDI